MNTYRKKSYRGKRSYSGRPHRRPADSYHQPLPTDSNRIPHCRHTLTKPDVEAVVDALLSGTLTQGKELERFESLLGKLTHSEYAIAFSSETAAVHAALACLKLEPEDEVITCTLHAPRLVNMIHLCGAQAVLADCDPNSLTLSVDAAEKAINENTKAIFTNNFGGHPSNLQALRALCDEHHLLLLEDASHGLGGKFRGHYVGNQADITCFSFNPTMAITTCEGGAVTTGNRAMAQWLRQFRNQGVQTDPRLFQSEVEYPAYYRELQFLGMNYHLSELQAALGRSQLTRLDRHIERRRAIAQVYFQKLGAIEELNLPYVADWAENAYHFYPIQFTESLSDKRDEIFNQLRGAGIEVQVHYVPIHRMPLYAGKLGGNDRFPNAETYFNRALSLPLFPDLSYKDLERITELLVKIINKYLNEAKTPGPPPDHPPPEAADLPDMMEGRSGRRASEPAATDSSKAPKAGDDQGSAKHDRTASETREKNEGGTKKPTRKRGPRKSGSGLRKVPKSGEKDDNRDDGDNTDAKTASSKKDGPDNKKTTGEGGSSAKGQRKTKTPRKPRTRKTKKQEVESKADSD